MLLNCIEYQKHNEIMRENMLKMCKSIQNKMNDLHSTQCKSIDYQSDPIVFKIEPDILAFSDVIKSSQSISELSSALSTYFNEFSKRINEYSLQVDRLITMIVNIHKLFISNTKNVNYTNLNDRINKLKDYTIQIKNSLNSFSENIKDDTYLRNNPEISALKDELLLSLNSLNSGIDLSNISKESIFLDIYNYLQSGLGVPLDLLTSEA